MKLGFEESQAAYTSGSQRAREWTERWVKDWVYCPNCGNQTISQFPANRPVADFFCPNCQEQYELKSKKGNFGASVVDGAYSAMRARLASDDNPSLLLLSYSLKTFGVVDALVIPKHFFVQEVVEKRPPLAPTARRAGWVGCKILLGRIPDSGKVYIVRNALPVEKEEVLSQWQRTLFLRDERTDARGWLIEVMNCIESIGRDEFRIEDVYAFEGALASLYPNNRHVKEKMRQQLQRLRDRGYLDFTARGIYKLNRSPPA
jgi:type II restriction enzyme